jgi:hypothetical protein
LFSEIDTSIPIADALKFPVYPIWIVHGGDHFTVIFCQQIPDNESFELYHWNGLPPGGKENVMYFIPRSIPKTFGGWRLKILISQPKLPINKQDEFFDPPPPKKNKRSLFGGMLF